MLAKYASVSLSETKYLAKAILCLSEKPIHGSGSKYKLSTILVFDTPLILISFTYQTTEIMLFTTLKV